MTISLSSNRNDNDDNRLEIRTMPSKSLSIQSNEMSKSSKRRKKCERKSIYEMKLFIAKRKKKKETRKRKTEIWQRDVYLLSIIKHKRILRVGEQECHKTFLSSSRFDCSFQFLIKYSQNNILHRKHRKPRRIYCDKCRIEFNQKGENWNEK